MSPAAAETVAGTVIPNTATLDVTIGGQTTTQPSNRVAITVAERLDLRLVRTGDGAVTVTTGAVAVPFVLTNAGNGEEAFALAATVSAGAGTVATIAIDTDGDGRYDPAHDTPITGGTTPSLAPGATLRLLVVITAPAGAPAADGTLTLTASAVTGSGSAGTTFAGRGDGGGDAVVGPTGAAGSAIVPIGAGTAAPSLIKSQVVRANDGSARAVPDAVITYTLEARFPAATPSATVADPIPAGTTYVPGSLTLDGATLTDAADGDAGKFDGTAIAVTLADIAGPATRTITFQTKIQ